MSAYDPSRRYRHHLGGNVYAITTDQPVCDFCLAPNPTWEYPAGPVDLPMAHPLGINASEDEWAACGTCHDMIERGLVHNLALYMISRQLLEDVIVIPDNAFEMVAAQINAFMGARTGEARPFQP